ncbi:MAG: hypothetical protein ACK6EB_29900, partial [Planctomyces sp.]
PDKSEARTGTHKFQQAISTQPQIDPNPTAQQHKTKKTPQHKPQQPSAGRLTLQTKSATDSAACRSESDLTAY